MKILALTCLIVLGLVVIASLVSWWRYRQWRRALNGNAFNQWLDRVGLILRQYGHELEERAEAEWKRDFDKGFAPDTAAAIHAGINQPRKLFTGSEKDL